MRELKQTDAIIAIVDDDPSVRRGLQRLIRSAGWKTETFASAQEFLSCPRAITPSCLVLDVTLPDLNGLELQKRVAADRIDMPIIFITGYGDVPMTVRAMKAGALEFLTKPFDDDVLLRAIRQALESSRTALSRTAEMQALRDRHASLSGREREVMALVVSGLLNKQVAGELGISEITVKAHRGKMVRKMMARSLADLVNIAAELAAADPAKSRYVADRRSLLTLVAPPSRRLPDRRHEALPRDLLTAIPVAAVRATTDTKVSTETIV